MLSGLINDITLNKLSLSQGLKDLPYAYFYATKFAIAPFWVPVFKSLMTLHLALMMIIFGSPFLPSILHFFLIFRDISIKLIIIPVSKFIFKILEALEESEKPISLIFIGIGSIPITLKAIKPLL